MLFQSPVGSVYNVSRTPNVKKANYFYKLQRKAQDKKLGCGDKWLRTKNPNIKKIFLKNYKK